MSGLEHTSKDRGIILLLLVIIVGLTGTAIKKENQPEWIKTRKKFKRVLAEIKGQKFVDRFNVNEVQQLFIEEGLIVDRCLTCHPGVIYENFRMAEIPFYFRTHPYPELMKSHPIEKFGCTFCHGGNGMELRKSKAHFQDKEGWMKVFVTRTLAKKYGYSLKDGKLNPMMEIYCNSCHLFERENPFTPHINRAKRLFEEKGCICCHKIRGKGGEVGPDLTYEGDKPKEKFDFSLLTKDVLSDLPLSIFSWQKVHLQYPIMVLPNSLMPKLDLKEDEIKDLLLFIMSLKKVPENLIYRGGVNEKDS